VSWPNGNSEIGTIATGKTQPIPGPYVGRFAPSPTGPLHFGSLIAAVASYLEARSRNGRWLLRVEDIDPPRAQPGAIPLILAALEAYGFEWDGPVAYQSRSRHLHDAAIATLIEQQMAYRCGCTRSELESAKPGALGAIYPGTCRNGCDAIEAAIRVRTNDSRLEFVDGLQGGQMQRLESESGDFIVLRKDGLIAYQLAVVVDDYLQGITDVVRGADLLASTPRQIWLQQQLDYPTPNYLHIPVATNEHGQKLSKSYGAGAIALDQVSRTLHAALCTLGQRPPADLASAAIAEVWQWAQENWQVDVIAGELALPVKKNLYQHDS